MSSTKVVHKKMFYREIVRKRNADFYFFCKLNTKKFFKKTSLKRLSLLLASHPVSQARKINFHILRLPFCYIYIYIQKIYYNFNSDFNQTHSRTRRYRRRTSKKNTTCRMCIGISNRNEEKKERHIGKNQCIKKPVFKIISTGRAYKERLPSSQLVLLSCFYFAVMSIKRQVTNKKKISTYLLYTIFDLLLRVSAQR